MFDFLKKKAECVVISDSSNYYYVDGVPHEIDKEFHVCDFYTGFNWDRDAGEFTIGYNVWGTGYKYAKPRVCVPTEKQARRLHYFIDMLFLLQFAFLDNIRKGRFKHMFICISDPKEAQYLNELFEDTDLSNTIFFCLYHHYRKKVHIIPGCVCVAYQEN